MSNTFKAKVKHGEEFTVGGITGAFSFFSVVSYSMECGDDPVAAIDRARAQREDLRGAIALASVLSDPPPPPVDRSRFEVGDVVIFEGVAVQIRKDHNNRVKLIPVDDAARWTPARMLRVHDRVIVPLFPGSATDDQPTNATVIGVEAFASSVAVEFVLANGERITRRYYEGDKVKMA